MKKTITQTCLATLALLFSFSFSTYAQTYYKLYMCGDATAKLRYPGESTLQPGDKIHWFKDGETTATIKEYDGNAGSTALDVPNTLSVGAHSYTSFIQSKDNCIGETSEAFTVYRLPATTLTLGAPTNNGTYCGEQSGQARSSQITASVTPLVADLPAGIDYTYAWNVTKGSETITSGFSNSANVFTIDTEVDGVYNINASVNYVLKQDAIDAGSVFKVGTNCSATSATPQTVTVTKKPGQPTIVVQ